MGLSTMPIAKASPEADLFERLRRNAPIVYGAGSAGSLIVKLLGEAGVTAALCVDKNAASIGRIGDVPVLPPESLDTWIASGSRPLIVAINSRHGFQSISAELLDRFPRLPQPVWGRDLIDAFAVRRCLQRLDDGAGIDLRDCMGCRADPGSCQAFRTGARALASELTRSLPERIDQRSRLNDFAYFVTNRCTLNCTHCVEALPYYEHHLTETAERIVASVRKVVDACHFIDRFSLTGGEVMLNKQLPAILEGLLSTPGIGFIYLYTSGTVVPKPELLEHLRNRRIAVNVSDYGANMPVKMRANMEKCLRVLDESGVAYRVLANKYWFDMGQFEYLGLDRETLRQSFANCAFTHCKTISNGILYRCPHQLAGMQLGKLPNVPGETVEIDRLNGTELAQALDQFIGLDFITACGHCKLSAGAQQVPAAVQSPRRIPLTLTP